MNLRTLFLVGIVLYFGVEIVLNWDRVGERAVTMQKEENKNGRK